MKDYIIKSLENYFAGKEESAVIEWSDEECFDYKSDEITLLVKDKEGNLYKILSFSNSLFLMLKDLKTNEFVISSAEYYYP